MMRSLLLSICLTLAAALAHALPDALSPDTVGGLMLAGKIPLAGPSRAAVVPDGDALFVTDNSGNLYRLEAKTGAIAWQVALADILAVHGAVPTRTVAVTDRAIVLGLRNIPVVAALDKVSGAMLWKMKIDDDKGAMITQTPLVAGSRVYVGVSGLIEEAAATYPKYACCTFRGGIVALDAETGKIVWKTHTVPEGFAGGSVWSGAPLLDASRHSLYVTSGNLFHAPPEVQACIDRNKDDRGALAACYPAGVWNDSILALDPDTGAVKWGFRADDHDVFTGACLVRIGGFCGGGGDFDFGNGALRWRAGGRDLVGAGEKSGDFWALDPDTGRLAWKTHLGPGGPNGGIEYGSAVAGGHVYVAEGNVKQVGHDPGEYALPSGQVINYGSYAALDAATGRIDWQVPDPAGADGPDNGKPCTAKSPPADCAGAYAKGAVTVANGVVFACSTAPKGPIYAFDGRTGQKLWEYETGVSCDTKATVAGDRVYWIVGPNLYVFAASPQPALLSRAAGDTAGPSVRDGVYAAAEADRGKALYRLNCATACHNENLTGAGPAPSLAGPDFRARWAGIGVGSLFRQIRATMPKTRPSGLPDDDYLAIIAYLLAANDFPPGKDALPKEAAALDRIAIAR
jgi:polyvinyl alcohol dehydrogenase (cytochrome)